TPLAQVGRVGDRVWRDINANGILDTGEPGVAGVEVNLYQSDGLWIASTVTDSNGNYEFPALAPGDYYIVFTSPEGYVFTSQDAGADDTVDSDASLGGVQGWRTSGHCQITTCAGQVRLDRYKHSLKKPSGRKEHATQGTVALGDRAGGGPRS